MHWLDEKGKTIDLKTCKKSELNNILQHYYGSVRTGKGKFYGISGFVGIRAGLNRHLNLPPISRSICLMKDAEFRSANDVFMAMLERLRRNNVSGNPIITEADMEKILSSSAMDTSHPRGLLNKVWFDIQYHFGRRGKEGNRDLKTDSFVVKADENGVKYCTMSFYEETKNAQERDEENRQGFMFEKAGDSRCPVASLQKYLAKLPQDAQAFYLHPTRDRPVVGEAWYQNTPLGINHLGSMLPRICKEAGTTVYTNHSLQSTSALQLADETLGTRFR
ncbi:hypothetical protein N1851_028304 [Merluccius polli]|uniref:ZMYM2-like/QRICH1 C-terminal domain-containing protein n=1 Tax=Merluccius polli TaxID=89951 RepID=A0AA47M8V0_MERPO|nr:hypothetical protein N1851_028304 [Merluccius polli]